MLEMIKNKKKEAGFTLIELLIVVAIIAILVAISIPIMGQITDNAKKATDDANARAAKAEIVIDALDGGSNSGIPGGVQDNVWYAYDAQNGKLIAAAEDGSVAIQAYNQKAPGKYFWVLIDSNDTVHGEWADKQPTSSFATPVG